MYVWLGILLVVLVALWCLFFRFIPQLVVQTSIVVGLVFTVASAVPNFFKLLTVAVGIIMCVGAVLKALWYWACRKKILVGRTLVEVALGAVGARPSTIAVTLVCCALQLLCTIVLLGSVIRWKATDPRTYLSVIVAYWVFDAVRYLAYATVCGIVGHWYFFDVASNGHPYDPATDATNSPDAQQQQEQQQQDASTTTTTTTTTPRTASKTPTKDAIVQAFTKSAGAIGLGAFLMSLLKIAQFYKEKVDNTPCPALKKALLCCVSCFKSTLRKFEGYAFVYVAVFGGGFLDAAREARLLVRRLKLRAALRHPMVNDVRDVSVLVISLCAWAATFGVAEYGYGVPYQVALPQATLAMWVAGSLMTVPMVLLEAPLATLIVLFGTDDGAALAATKPDVHARLDRAFRIIWRFKYLRKDMAARAHGCCGRGGATPSEQDSAREIEQEDQKVASTAGSAAGASAAFAGPGHGKSLADRLAAIKSSCSQAVDDVTASAKGVLSGKNSKDEKETPAAASTSGDSPKKQEDPPKSGDVAIEMS